MIEISVIVPIYKVEQYLNQCVESILNQTFSKFELILVDDGSPDNCPEMCDEWEKQDSRVVVIHKENGGLSDARNAGLDIARGNFIFFVDSDDWIKNDTLEKVYYSIIKEDADICACGILNCFGEKEISWGIKDVIGNSRDMLRLLYKDTAYPVAAWNKLYKKDMWDNLRFPVGKICEDAMTTYQLLDRAKKIVQISDPLYCYRIREGSIMTSPFSLKRMDEEEAWRMNYDFIKKNYPDLKKYAYDFYLLKISCLISTIGDAEYKKFEREYLYLKRILKKNVFYLLFFSKLRLKQRIKSTLDIIRM